MGMSSAERNQAIDKYNTLVDLIDQKKLDYSKSALEKDLKAFKFKSWVECNKILTFIMLLFLIPFTGGISLLGLIILLFMSSKADEGYQNYNKLIQQLKNNDFNKSNFNGERTLNNDAYKIYLTKAYGIEKNSALDKIVCRDNIFDSVDQALAHAHSLDNQLPQKEAVYASTKTAPVNISLDDDEAKKYNITFDGEKYSYKSYRYDKLGDAIVYARAEESRNKS
jgi:hypothetical protein